MLLPVRLPLTKARADGLFLLLVGSIAFLLIGWRLESSAAGAMVDFRTAYSSARCLLAGCDPYQPNDVLNQYRGSGAARPADNDGNRFTIARNVYPPTEFAITVPFAAFPYGLAQALWFALTAGSMIAAGMLMGSSGTGCAPQVAGALLCYFLIDCVSLLYCGNPAGAAVGLCAVAAWCFIRERCIPVGVLCMAASLALKPQDGGLVWLYFLLSGRQHRRRAWQSLVLAAAIGLPMLLWTAHLSPQWARELAANLRDFTGHGGTNDPGPDSSGGHGICMITDLQVVLSFFWDNPRFYNPASLALWVPPIVLWAAATLRSCPTRNHAWFALAAIAPLTMLPVYHRQYDAKLVMLTVPACAILWTEGGWLRRCSIAINLAVFSVIGDIPWVIVMSLLGQWQRSSAWMSARFASALLALPAPLTLVAMSCFYLWIYIQRSEPQARRMQERSA
jgi:hypothetical protein